MRDRERSSHPSKKVQKNRRKLDYYFPEKMAMAVANHNESGGDNINRHLDSSGKYVRYTAEQVEALERVYSECPKPTSLRRQQLISECPILAHIEPKQIKVWFQNRR